MILEDHVTIEERDSSRHADALSAIRNLPVNIIQFTEAGQHRRLRARMNGVVLNLSPFTPNTVAKVSLPQRAYDVVISLGTYDQDRRHQTLVDFTYNDLMYRIFCR